MEKAHLSGFAFLSLMLASVPATGQHPIVYEVMGDEPFDHFGTSIALLNDIDGDRVRDFVAGTGRGQGYIRLISGKSGTILRTWRGTRRGEELGYVMTAMGDLDGDGNTDFAAASSYAEISFFSPLKQDHLARINVDLPPLNKSVSITAMTSGDFDGDGIGDTVMGDP